MKPIVTCKISGLQELQKALEGIPRQIARKGVRKALHAGGVIMQDAMTIEAPKDTGFLREHFGQRIKLLKGGDIGGSCYIGPEGKIDYPDRDGGYREKTNKSGGKYEVGRISVASVARYFQYGTVKMAANPFMTRAWEAKKEVTKNAMIDVLRMEVLEAAILMGTGTIR
jgi:HK97 gp10 family phage protein